jgi:hypothetical protein
MALVLDAAPASDDARASLFTALSLFITSWWLWYHHWRILRRETVSSEAVVHMRPVTPAVTR